MVSFISSAALKFDLFRLSKGGLNEASRGVVHSIKHWKIVSASYGWGPVLVSGVRLICISSAGADLFRLALQVLRDLLTL